MRVNLNQGSHLAFQAALAVTKLLLDVLRGPRESERLAKDCEAGQQYEGNSTRQGVHAMIVTAVFCGPLSEGTASFSQGMFAELGSSCSAQRWPAEPWPHISWRRASGIFCGFSLPSKFGVPHCKNCIPLTVLVNAEHICMIFRKPNFYDFGFR